MTTSLLTRQFAVCVMVAMGSAVIASTAQWGIFGLFASITVCALILAAMVLTTAIIEAAREGGAE